MNRISISQAWDSATSFFSGQAANHAIALIGVGIVIPFVLQFVLGGGTAMVDPTGASASVGFAAVGALAIVLGLLNYVLQTGSYFASWRIGLTNGAEPLGSALGYGLIASLPILGLLFVIITIFGIIGFLLFGGALMTMMGGGQPSPESIATGGVTMLLLFPVFLFLALWLGARFCCTGPIMADQRSYNIIGALGGSWRMTAASQWKIMGYFVLIGIILSVLVMIVGMVAGVSMFAAGGVPSAGSMVGLVVGVILLSIPMAYLQVAVPAGIYRALGAGDTSSVFA